MGATHVEKSTVKTGQLNAVSTEGGTAAGLAAGSRPSGEPEIAFSR